VSQLSVAILSYERVQLLVAVTEKHVIEETVGSYFVKATNFLLIVVNIDYEYKECVTDASVIGSSALRYYQPARSRERLHWTGLI
jgi:hypothetical protein